MTESANDKKTENGSKGALWSDLVDLLPGFAKLAKLSGGYADSFLNRVREIDYRKAVLKETDARGLVSTKGLLPNAGFVELTTDAGYILMSAPLKRAFLYPFHHGDAFLKEMMEPLLSAAGWVDALQRQNMVIRETLAPGQEPPYFALAREFEKDIRAAQERAEATAGDFDIKPYFTEELHEFYGRRMTLHMERAGEHALRGEENAHRWETESNHACMLLHSALSMLKKHGVKKIVFAKARPEAYEEAVKRIAEIRAQLMPGVAFAGDRMGFRLAFQRTLSKPGEVEAQVTNIEKAKAFIREQWQGYLSAAREFQDQNGADGANPHTEKLKRARNALRDLDALISNGVTEIGYEPGDTEDAVVAKIAAAKPPVTHEVADEQPGPVVTPPVVADNEAVVPLEVKERQRAAPPIAAPPAAPAQPPSASSPLFAPPNGGAQARPIASSPPAPAAMPRTDTTQARPAPVTQPTVREQWKYAKTIFAWAKDKLPTMILGAATGAAVRLGAQFAMAAFVATTPGIVTVIGTAMIAGAAAGAASRLAVTAAFGGAKKQEEGWKRKALIEGALMGALGGALGASAMQFAHEYLQSWWGHTSTGSPASPPPNSDPATGTPIVEPPHAPAPPPADVPARTGHAVPLAPGASVSLEAIAGDLHALLTPDQLALLPNNVSRLATSSSPKALCLFCKEASYLLLNAPPRDAASIAAGAKLLTYGVQIAHQADLHGPVSRMLNADLAYVKAWGIGTDKDLPQAIACARRAGNAVNNYGPRLLRYLGLS
ncbi:hypothetical protein [Bradyrhizobium acaciae]|uniref:hypothetical protein n=1 Tax=Bradyrhizobium acaciae TaxID=2683706 RepID=UPI001E4E5650|nr:hypothetical protein [Bradyrhizobium acaciae]MCC8978895.1 hypothetical protein [Bradyrhizobium acaciae]